MAQTDGGRSPFLCGTKRPRPADDNCDEQPLAKKFGLLHLNTTANAKSPASHPEQDHNASTPRGDQDSMLLDDTKYTVYIHDLDREIAEIESQENVIPFLPRIAENLTSIPPSILSPPKPQGNELVLYSEPSSLTVPRDQDCVRRAIIETRARTRKTQAENMHSGSSCNSIHPSSMEATDQGNERNEPDDTMDIDDEL